MARAFFLSLLIRSDRLNASDILPAHVAAQKITCPCGGFGFLCRFAITKLKHMRYFKQLWSSKERAGTWIAFEVKTVGCPLMFTFSRNGYARQWFAYIHLPLLSIAKNNSQFEIGLLLYKLFIGFNFHLNFPFPVRKTRQKSLDISITPYSKWRFAIE